MSRNQGFTDIIQNWWAASLKRCWPWQVSSAFKKMMAAAQLIFSRVTESKQQIQHDCYGPAHKLLSVQLLPYVTLHSLQKHWIALATFFVHSTKTLCGIREGDAKLLGAVFCTNLTLRWSSLHWWGRWIKKGEGASSHQLDGTWKWLEDMSSLSTHALY